MVVSQNAKLKSLNLCSHRAKIDGNDGFTVVFRVVRRNFFCFNKFFSQTGCQTYYVMRRNFLKFNKNIANIKKVRIFAVLKTTRCP